MTLTRMHKNTLVLKHMIPLAERLRHKRTMRNHIPHIRRSSRSKIHTTGLNLSNRTITSLSVPIASGITLVKIQINRGSRTVEKLNTTMNLPNKNRVIRRTMYAPGLLIGNGTRLLCKCSNLSKSKEIIDLIVVNLTRISLNKTLNIEVVIKLRTDITVLLVKTRTRFPGPNGPTIRHRHLLNRSLFLPFTLCFSLRQLTVATLTTRGQ